MDKMLLGLCLAIMFVITLISIIGGNSFVNILIEHTIDTTAIVNGSTNQFEIDLTQQSFGLDPITGGIALVVAIAVVGGIISIQFLGSGLNDSGVRILLLSIFYGGLWTILSILAYNLIVAIEVFGLVIYLVLTIVYAMSVVGKYFGNSGD